MVPEDIILPVRRQDGKTLEDRMTENAYDWILPERYLRRGSDGELLESQEDLFDRVAKNIATAEAVYHNQNVTVYPCDVKPNHPRRHELVEEVFGVDARSQKGSGILTIKEDGDWIPADSTPGTDKFATGLTEKNASKFAYDTVVERAPDDVVEQMEEKRAEFREVMENLEFIPNSPTLMNAGDELQQLSACFVNSPADDIDDIHTTAKEAAQVFQSGGGMGYSFSDLRPYGDAVGSTGGIASGPITFMRTYDQMCETIAQGGARRGAQMGIMRVSHPDVIQFIHAKNKDVSLAETLRLNDPDDFTHNSFSEALQEARQLIDNDGRVPEHLRNAVEGHLSNFNISVGITDGFMEAVKNDEEFTFTNPRTGDPHIATPETEELYSLFGLGQYVQIGEELSVPANEIWERIIKGAHENGEPGVIFLERVNKRHSFDVEKHPEHRILATNPCGEQPLEEYEACNLGHINLSTLVDVNSGVQDWRKYDMGSDDLSLEVAEFIDEALDVEELYRRVDIGTRFLDNVVTMSDFPIPEIEEKVREMRKIGLGIMGYGQLLPQIGVEYGSEVGNEIARQLMIRINHRSKEMSKELTYQRGVFDEWEKSKYANPMDHPEWFRKQTGENPEEWANASFEMWDGDEYKEVTGFPIRNHNTTTIAPTGTTSMVGDTTGGCEPIYDVVYFKNVSDDVQGDEMLVELDDYFFEVLEANGIDPEEVEEEARAQMSRNEFNGIESLESVPDSLGELFVTTDDLTAKEHAQVQCAFQKGVDSSISKTVNAPNDSTPEDAREVFEYIYDHGGKGVTYYRDGTRSKQVLTTRAQNTEFSDSDDLLEATVEQALEDEDFREELLDELDIDEPVDEDLPWYENGHYAKKRDRPRVLSGSTERIETGYGKMYVNINEDGTGRPFELFANIGNSGGLMSSFTEALAKVISLSLRSGVNPNEIAEELQGIRSPKVAWDQGQQVNSIPDAIGITMQRHLENSAQESQGTRVFEQEEMGTDPASPKGAEVMSQTQMCPECKEQTFVNVEGCKKCSPELGGCGYSEC